MTGKLEPVIYRNETPPPDKPGWWYLEMGGGLRPVEVCPWMDDGLMIMLAGHCLKARPNWRWFGQVPEVREG